MSANEVHKFLDQFSDQADFSSDVQNLLRQEALLSFLVSRPEYLEELKQISKIGLANQRKRALENFVQNLINEIKLEDVPGFYETNSHFGANSKVKSAIISDSTNSKMNSLANLLRFKYEEESSDKVVFDSSAWDKLSLEEKSQAQKFFKLVFGDKLDTPEEWVEYLNSDPQVILDNMELRGGRDFVYK